MTLRTKGGAAAVALEACLYALFAGLLFSRRLREVSALLLLLLLIRDREDARPPTPWGIVVGLFLAVNIATALLGEFPRRALAALRFYPIGLVMFLATRLVVARGGGRRVSASVLVMVLLLAADIFWQYATGRSLLTGNLPLSDRYSGALPHPADVSLLALLLPLAAAFWLAGNGPDPGRAVGAGAVILVVATAVNLGGSRAAWLAVVVGAMASGWLLRSRKALAAVAAILLVSGVLAGASGAGTAVARLLTLDPRSDETQRVLQWKASIALFAERPVFGHGPHSFSWIVRQRWKEPGFDRLDPLRAPYPHNVYLESLAGTGLVGFVSFLALFTLPAIRDRNREPDDLERAAAVSLAAFAAVGLVDLSLSKDWVQLCLWLPLGILAAGGRPRAPSAERQEESPDTGQHQQREAPRRR